MANNNLEALLGKPNTQPNPTPTPITKQQPLSVSVIDTFDEPITLRIPVHLVDWMRNYRYAKIIATGNTSITFRDVWIDAINSIKKTTKYEVKPRPASVRENEKKVGRKRNK